MYIPRVVQIETMNGVCNARCVMCNIEEWTRKSVRMSEDDFAVILDRLLPYVGQIEQVNLQGCNEPLLDKGLAEKVVLAKDRNFKSVGFATNCEFLTEEKSEKLLKAKLDTLICSIDGITKETHEAIRVRTNFDTIMKNVHNFIKMRDEIGATKIVIRFIRQDANKHEWEAYKEYWERYIDPSKNDFVTAFNVHNHGGTLDDYENLDVLDEALPVGFKCENLYERMNIYASGDVALCDGETNGKFPLGNAVEDDPIALYNGSIFNSFRQKWEQRKVSELSPCGTCTIPRSRAFNE